MKISFKFTLEDWMYTRDMNFVIWIVFNGLWNDPRYLKRNKSFFKSKCFMLLAWVDIKLTFKLCKPFFQYFNWACWDNQGWKWSCSMQQKLLNGKWLKLHNRKVEVLPWSKRKKIKNLLLCLKKLFLKEILVLKKIFDNRDKVEKFYCLRCF